MNAPPRDELDVLMARLADGDRTVFSEVFKRLWPPVERFCRGMLKSDADAADAAQQAMVKILERAPAYDSTRPAVPWALAIATWECRTLARRRQRRGEVAEERAGEPAGGHPEEEIVRRDLLLAAADAVGTLSSVDQETLAASFFDEVSTTAGATLRKRRERALDRLRAGFRRLYGFE